MAKKETLKTFLNNLDTFDNIIMREVIKGFNRVTDQVLSDAQEMAPVASGALRDSAAVLTAKQTPEGIKSAVLYKIEYAKRLHERNKPFRPVGTFSHYDGGQKHYKSQQGENQWLQKSVDNHQKDLINEVSAAIDEAWSRI